MGVREKLSGIVGNKNFSDNIEDVKKYSEDYSLCPPGMPNYLVRPKGAEEIQKIIEFANENKIPVVPCSSRVHFHGATIPKQGGIVLDLGRMNRILEIDKDNRSVRIEAGVTWDMLVSALEKNGYRIIMPLLPPAERSVVTDYLEREVPTNTVYDYGEPLQSMEVVWPTGEIFRLGSASVNGFPNSVSKGANPTGPGIDFYRFLQGAQGTMGVVTWAHLKIESIPKIDKILLAPIHDLTYAIEFLYRILPRRIGQETLLLNNVALASIVAEDFPGDFQKLRAELPPWTLIMVLSGLLRRPEEKIAYEEEFLSEVLKNEFPEMHLSEVLPGFPGLRKPLMSMIRKPWSSKVPYWKNRYKGACQSLFFITKPVLVPRFIASLEKIAAGHGYPFSEIGGYLQPIEHNRACQLEFHFFYDPNNGMEKENVRHLYVEAAQALAKEGALFTRPYGDLAPMVYDRSAGYAVALRRVKKVFDPNNIMNPGNLCF